MTTVIVDYGSGNLRSAAKAFERAASDSGSGERILVTDKAAEVAAADRVVLPGVGAYGDCMSGLSSLPGMMEALEEVAIRRQRPFLGICVGMQLMAERGVEHGIHRGLGWIAGAVEAIDPGPQLKVPHMGWNELRIAAPDHPLFAGLEDGAHF